MFVHASLRAIQPVVGGARAVVTALLDVVGPRDWSGCLDSRPRPPSLLAWSENRWVNQEGAPKEHYWDSTLTSFTVGMGTVAETFRNNAVIIERPRPA